MVLDIYKNITCVKLLRVDLSYKLRQLKRPRKIWPRVERLFRQLQMEAHQL